MNKTASTLRWSTAVLLAGALALPGLGLARGGDWDGHDGDRHGHRDWHGEGHRGHRRGHGHGHGHRHRDYERRLVVVQEPVYLAPRPTLVAPLWQPGLGINLYLPLFR